MKTPCFRLTLRLAKYPATEGTTVYRWSSRPYADASAWSDGRILNMGEITRSCTDQDGNYEISRVSVELSDDDGLFRGLLDATATKYWIGREAYIELLSEAGRSAGSTWRPLFRGVISSLQVRPKHRASLEISDLVGNRFSAFDLERTIGVEIGDEHTNLPDDSRGHIYPIIVGEHSDIGALDVNGESAAKGLLPVIDTGDYRIDGSDEPIGSIGPPETVTAVLTGPGSGTVTRHYAVVAGNASGLSRLSTVVSVAGCPSQFDATTYVAINWSAVDGATYYLICGRSHNPPTTWLDGSDAPGTSYNDDDDLDVEKQLPDVRVGTAVPDGVWGRLLVSIGATDIHKVYASDLADGDTPKRVALGDELDGVEYLTPDSADWPHANPYIELTHPTTGEVIRQTVIYVRGPRLTAHRAGSVTIAVNGCGMEATGDGTGNLVDEAFKQGQLFINEHILKNAGTGYRSGVYGPLEAFANGDKQLWTSKWAAAQTVTVTRIGGTGYKGAWAIYEPMTVREWVRRFCVTFDCRLSVNSFGQLYPVLIDDTATATTGRLYREFVEGVEVVDQQLAYDEIENRIAYVYDWDSDAAAYRAKDLTIEDAESIAAHVPGGVIGTPNVRGVLQKDTHELFCTRDADTAFDAMARRLTRNTYVPRYVTIEQDLMGVEDDLGDQIRITHREGIGSGGDVATPFVVLRHTVIPDGQIGTRLVCIDMDRLLNFDMNMTLTGPEMTGSGFTMR